MSKPGLPSGTRDFGPETMLKRKFILGTIENVFRLHGFRPIETPAVENLATLTGKYGDEGDQLLFKILNNGDFLAKADEVHLREKNSKSVLGSISDRGLRYDLTVPLARFVVMNRDKLTFPFKRYQMQPVWRADRPQKGRYREFWQCDADVVGSNSTLNEADLISIYDESFTALGLAVEIRINHRKVFDAFATFLGGEAGLSRFMQLIDKADKIGFDGVARELEAAAIPNAVSLWQFLYEINQLKSNHTKLDALQNHPQASAEEMERAIQDLNVVFSLVKPQNNFILDLSLARGLSYYTGCVFEVTPNPNGLPEGFNIGSIGGGGRYDNLTGVFGLKDFSGVGIYFGLDRIYDIMEAANIFPNTAASDVRFLACAMDESAFPVAVEIVNLLRKNAISAEVYPSATKLKKQLDYANDRSIPFAAIIGENELKNKEITVKNLTTGTQSSIAIENIKENLHLWKF
ncbi:MAG: histidine--tRNA ligase [Bacteroidia bacterium]|nr:histidine--tRNA ligase [Bacteroidia bacterium]